MQSKTHQQRNRTDQPTSAMEEKKSGRADLEHGRLQAFLLGTIVALACLFVALEYSYDDDDYDADLDELEAMLDGIELSALKMPEEMVPLPTPKKPEVPTRLNIVDNDSETTPPEEAQEQPDDGLQDDTATEQEDDEKMVATNDDGDVLDMAEVEDLPEFPGGAIELLRWLTRNLNYPQAAMQQKIQGRVLAQFIVDTDGSVHDIQIVQKLNPLCDREALRVLRMMPAWKAGRQHDKPCRTMVCIPIVFKL